MSNEFEIKAKEELSASELILATARGCQIKTQADAESANGVLKEIKSKAKEIESTRIMFVKPLNDQVKVINEWFKKPLAILEDAERVLKNGIMAYDNEVRRKLAEEEARLRAEAAERERKEREKLEKRAEKAEASGKTEKAEELRQQAEEVTYTPPVLAAPKSTISKRTDWSAEVTDMKALCAAIASGAQPVTLVMANMPTLNKMATALKENMNIPGVKSVSKQVPISR